MNQTSNYFLSSGDINLIRDCALRLSEHRLDDGIALMTLANRLRPNGKLIEEHLQEMKARKLASWHESIRNLQISPDKKIIFIHIPKAGGTSVDSSNLFSSRKSGHHEYKYLRLMVSKNDSLEGWKVFCFCRNPWDRLASAFYYLSAGGSNKSDLEVSKKYLSVFKGDLSEFLNHFCLSPDNYLDVLHFRPMASFIDPSSVDLPFFIQKLEFSSDLTRLRDFLGFSIQIDHLRKNPNHRIGKSSYDSEIFARISEIYGDDIKLFGYDSWRISDLIY